MSDTKKYKTFKVGYNLYVEYSDGTEPIDRYSSIEMTALTAEEARNDAEELWESNDLEFFDDEDEMAGITLLEIDIDSTDEIKEAVAE
jgi:general stress protein 26